jgi:hypothetical protein
MSAPASWKSGPDMAKTEARRAVRIIKVSRNFILEMFVLDSKEDERKCEMGGMQIFIRKRVSTTKERRSSHLNTR